MLMCSVEALVMSDTNAAILIRALSVDAALGTNFSFLTAVPVPPRDTENNIKSYQLH